MYRHPTLQEQWGVISGYVPTKNGDIGLELEIEGEHLPREVTGWVVKAERSLRGANGRNVSEGEDHVDTPQEYVLYRPTALSTVGTRLSVLHSALTLPSVKVNLTPRASTHVHINMTTETLNTIIGFMVVFTCIEPVLMRLCGPMRNGNLFCLPSYETGDLSGKMEQVVSAIQNGVHKYWPKRGKYASMNIDTLMSFGSIEIRCFPNVIDPTTIMKWVTWMVNIRTLAREWDKTWLEFISKAYDEPHWLLEKVFGNESLFMGCVPNTPTDLIEYGVEAAYEAARHTEALFKEQEKKGMKLKPLPDVTTSWSPEALPSDWFINPPEPEPIWDEAE